MIKQEYDSIITKIKFHNLCYELKAPQKIGRLLGLNLPFCLESPLPIKIQENNEKIEKICPPQTMAMQNAEDLPPREYNPNLYIPSEWEPDAIHPCQKVECKLDVFEQKLISLNNTHQLQRPRSNISSRQQDLMNFCKQNDDYMAVSTDKSLGAALIERHIYNKTIMVRAPVKPYSVQRNPTQSNQQYKNAQEV